MVRTNDDGVGFPGGPRSFSQHLLQEGVCTNGSGISLFPSGTISITSSRAVPVKSFAVAHHGVTRMAETVVSPTIYFPFLPQ